MSLLFPLGLLGLIAIPVLIIIYIIKNKYTEQVVSSTYLWTLSERFLKRKNPINIITGIISLILQILAVIAISFAIAHPVFTLPGAAFDYCFVLDGSGSMNIVVDGSTRLEKGLDEIRSVINSSVNGSAYTLVYATDTADVMFEEVNDKERALLLLDEIEPSYTQSSELDALNVASAYFNENPSIKTYLVTDKTYEEHDNVSVIKVGSGEQNFSISNLSGEIADGMLKISGEVSAYGGEQDLDLQLFIDGEEIEDAALTVRAGEEPVEFVMQIESRSYSSIRVQIVQSDSLDLDNQSIIYNLGIDSTYQTLIVSERPFFIKTVLGVNNIETLSPEKYQERVNSGNAPAGYGLYVFDSWSPDAVPSDGAVWFFNPTQNTARAGFTFQNSEDELFAPIRAEYSKSSATVIQNILANTVQRELLLNQYVKCGFIRSFATVLSYDSNPLIFAGTNDYGNREVVFAFNLHDTDIAVTPDFVILVANLLDYTFPPIIDKATYFSGESMSVYVPANCDSIRVDTPMGGVVYLETGADTAEYRLDEVGEYTITLLTDRAERVVNVFADLPLEERNVTAAGAAFTIAGEPENNGRDGIYNDILYLFIFLAVIFIADWMVYCYEQYQLR